MKSILAFPLLALAVSLHPLAAQEQKPPAKTEPAPAEFKIPDEAAKKPNPIKPTESSVAEGRHLYSSQCAMCHGATGDGKGDVATTLQLTSIKDWTKPDTLKDWSDGALFYVITKGKDPMPGQEGRMKNDQKWHLVNFIRSLGKK